jgi:transposase, IS5 family
MRGHAGFFDFDERLKELSAKGDALERLSGLVDFELFRPDLEQAVPRADRSRGGRPPFDHVFMFKVLILQASHSLSDERTEFLIKDRLSFMRFLELGLADAVPDANTIWTFREALTRATLQGRSAIEVLFGAYEAALTRAGFLAMGGQIIDATIIAAPKQRNTDAEKREIKEGRVPSAWRDKPAKLAQKDRDARWTVKWSKGKPADDGSPRMDLAIPAFGYKNHLGIDRRHGLIRTWLVTDAARHDGAQMPALVSMANTASDVWADTAYRSKANETYLAGNALRSQIHRKKPKGKTMPRHVARANGAKSKVRAAVEHVFAHQKGLMALVVRTIGLARARVKIGLANLVYNMRRAAWLAERGAPA